MIAVGSRLVGAVLGRDLPPLRCWWTSLCTIGVPSRDVFRNAHYGRRLIAFDTYVGRKYEEGPLTCVVDARKRFRDPMTSTDLASALATFTYAHQSRQQDRLYAAIGLVKTGNIISPDYTKTTQQVFLEAATCIIRDRKDLYLLGNKILFTKRTMPDISTWVL